MSVKNFFSKFKIELLIFFIIFISYVAITGGNFWESDGQAAYLTTRSIVEDHDPAMPCYFATRSSNGKCYTQYGLFMSITIIPFYLIEKFFRDIVLNTYFFSGFFSSFTNPFITALLVVLIYKYLIKLKFPLSIALITTLIFAYTTYLPAYTKTLFSEPLITLLLLSSLYLLLFYSLTNKVIFTAGILFGLGFLTKLAFLIFTPVFLFVWLRRKLSLKQLFLFCLPIFLSFCIFFLYNYLRFNNIFDTGYRNIKFDHPLFYGLYLHLLSPGKSFFFYQPIILFSLFGLKSFFQKEKTLFIIFGMIFITELLFYSVYMHPMGDLTWGSRYLYPTLTFFILGLGYFIKENNSKLLKSLFFLFLFISLLIQFSSVYLSYHRYFAFLSKRSLAINQNITSDYTRIAYNQIEYSPLIKQWQLIFKWGYKESEKDFWQEAFQEYPPSALNAPISPPDLFFLRSKHELNITAVIMFIELLLILKLLGIYRRQNRRIPFF